MKEMETNELLQYESPKVELINVEVERGFAASEDFHAPGWDDVNGEHDFWK